MKRAIQELTALVGGYKATGTDEDQPPAASGTMTLRKSVSNKQPSIGFARRHTTPASTQPANNRLMNQAEDGSKPSLNSDSTTAHTVAPGLN